MMMTLFGAEGETKRELVKVLFDPKGCTDEQVKGLVEQYCNSCKSMMESSKEALKTANLVYTDKGLDSAYLLILFYLLTRCPLFNQPPSSASL